jgi:protein-arginine kinase activator protein McsA
MTDGASTNCGDFEKLEKRVIKLEGEIAQLKQKLGTKVTQEEFEKLKTKVEKFMEKGSNRNA